MSSHSPAEKPRNAASRFLTIQDGLNDLRRFIEGVWMAAGDVSDTAEQGGLRGLLDVACEKLDGMKAAMQEARDALEREQNREIPQ
jgi:hypothetical protein